MKKQTIYRVTYTGTDNAIYSVDCDTTDIGKFFYVNEVNLNLNNPTWFKSHLMQYGFHVGATWFSPSMVRTIVVVRAQTVDLTIFKKGDLSMGNLFNAILGADVDMYASCSEFDCTGKQWASFLKVAKWRKFMTTTTMFEGEWAGGVTSCTWANDTLTLVQKY